MQGLPQRSLRTAKVIARKPLAHKRRAMRLFVSEQSSSYRNEIEDTRKIRVHRGDSGKHSMIAQLHALVAPLVHAHRFEAMCLRAHVGSVRTGHTTVRPSAVRPASVKGH